MTEQTRQAVDDYLKATGKKAGEFLFTSWRRPGGAMTTRQYARLVSEWIAGIGLDPHIFGTHSLRRTKATLICRRTGNLRAVQLAWTHENGKFGSVSRSMTRLPLPNKSKSEVSGQSGHCSARMLTALRANRRHVQRSKLQFIRSLRRRA